MESRRSLRLLALFSIVLVVLALFVYQRLAGPKVYADDGSAIIIEIPRATNFDALCELLTAQNLIQDSIDFRRLAEQQRYDHSPVRSGRFAVPPGVSAHELISILQSGKQSPVNLVFSTERELTDVAAKADRFLALDAEELLELFADSLFLDSVGYSQQELMSIFIPNTYEVYWDILPRDLIDRMLTEHDRFWKKENRWDKASKLKLTPRQVYTLASIIERETLQDDEKQRMAGVYYNRLQEGMRLQADPTAVFASRDFNTHRVTNYHLKFDSPYNTYRYAGLPPGPITMASISSIDAVLDLEKHDYIFFCARGDGSGYHNFAHTLQEHKKNAAQYRKNRRERRGN